MSTAEVLGEGGAPAEVTTIHEDMLASIERTAIFSPRLPHLPLINPTALLEGDRRVQGSVDPEELRHLTVVGPDAIKFDGEPGIVLGGFRASELLGLLVLVRSVVRPRVYKDMGFFQQASTNAVRNSTLTALFNNFSTIITSDGAPLITRRGAEGGGRAGIDRFTVTDVRHTVAYKEARRISSLGRFEAHIRDGGGHPGLFEKPSIEAARMALRGFAGSDMTNEQRERFRALSKETAETIAHRSDEYDEKNAMDARTNYARSLVADAFQPLWQDKPSCGPEMNHIFFPTGIERRDMKKRREAKAKEVCRTCPIQVDCLEDALDRAEPYGVWGGTNEDERKLILKSRASQAS